MAKVVGDIIVEVGGDVTPLTRAMRKGGQELDNFTAKGARMGRRMAKIGAAAAAALTLGTTAATGLARRAADAAVEIDNLARVAGTTPAEFQRMAIAAETVGISHEKLADIFKDMRDRVGDFIATGAGPMADFFEKIAPAVGVTAEQFARLSGPEALQLYISSLEKAGVTQSEMVFYLEAMASDTTALIPLLKNGGQAMRELGDRAEEAGRIMSNDTMRGAKNLKSTLDELEGEIRAELTEAMIGLEDELVVLAEFVRDYGIPALEGLITFGARAAGGIREIAEAIEFLRTKGTSQGGKVAESIGNTYGIDWNGEEGSADPIDDADGPGDPRVDTALRDLYGMDGEGDKPGLKPENQGTTQVDDPFDLGVIPLGDRDPSTLGLGTGSKSGGRGRSADRGPTQDDLDALAESLATERELVEIHYQEKLAQLDEFREAGIGKEQEWNSLEEKIHKEHAERIEELEAQKRQARMAALSGMFGDLSTLMQTENKKLFKIGQAAAIAEATISGYQAAVDAWQKGMKIGGPPLAAAFTAASLVKTGSLIAGIASTSSSGGSTAVAGGAAGAAATPAAEAAAAPQQVNLNIGDAEFMPRSAVISLAEKLQELSREGAIVTVN